MWIALRRTVAQWVRAVARWIDVPDREAPTALIVQKDTLYHRALVLTAAADQRHSPDHGEAKRHQVYSQLQKEFPAQGKRTLSLAIEAALAGSFAQQQ